MLTERDINIINWIEQVQIADSSQIQRVFFVKKENGEEIKNKRIVCGKRLFELVKKGYLRNNKKDRENINQNLLYYKTKPENITNKLRITEFIVKLQECGRELIDYVSVEKGLHDFKSNVTVRCEPIDKMIDPYYFFVKVHWGNNSIQDVIKKYEDYFDSKQWVDRFKKFPQIVLLTKYNLKITSELEVRIIPYKEKGAEKISNIDMDGIFN